MSNRSKKYAAIKVIIDLILEIEGSKDPMKRREMLCQIAQFHSDKTILKLLKVGKILASLEYFYQQREMGAPK